VDRKSGKIFVVSGRPKDFAFLINEISSIVMGSRRGGESGCR
jgi:hypothetical protein